MIAEPQTKAKTAKAEVQTPILGPQRELCLLGGETNTAFLHLSKNADIVSDAVKYIRKENFIQK